MALRTRTLDERGMTLVEVMAAMIILLVGVLGTLILIQGGLSSTSATTAREQGTNLARDVVERSREAAYDDLTTASAAQTLVDKLPDATGLAGSTFEVNRRNVTFSVNVAACSIDDPTDGAGAGDDSFCADPPNPSAPATPPPLPPLHARVLGIDVAIGGSLVDTVCDALGLTTSDGSTILGQLTSAVTTVAPISVCPDSPSGDGVKYDRRPDDLRRLRVEVTWERGSGGTGSVSQTTLLTNPVQS